MSIWESDDLGEVSKKVCWALSGAASFIFGLRVYCRLRYSSRQGGGLFVDDFITLACLIVLLTFCILLSIATQYGVGKHYETLSATDQVEALKWNALLNAITPWICTLPKFAIIATLSRILSYGTKTTVAVWGLALTSQATVLGLMIWGLVQCSPTTFQWDKSIEGGTCADPDIYVRLAYVTYIYSTLLDVFFALYPVPFVMRLKMPVTARLGVAFSLSLSWMGFAISIYKFSIFPRLSALLPTDPSYPLVYLCMTHAAEGSFLVISTSLATLRPLFRDIKQHVTDQTLHNNNRTPHLVSISRRHVTITCTDESLEEYTDGKRSPLEHISLVDQLNQSACDDCGLEGATHMTIARGSSSTPSASSVDEKY